MPLEGLGSYGIYSSNSWTPECGQEYVFEPASRAEK
ncbi:MAG: hypothetical protein JWR18_1874, partial [Segetibacter sp.]|nr:hypothetical protein [Segetibacter sp.]